MLTVPVLAASACYGIGEACRCKASLERKPREAVRFYAAIVAATLIGLSLNFMHIDPGKALFWAAILNGVVAAPFMAIIMVMASSKKVMGQFVISPHLKAMGWLATSVMLCACIGVFVTWSELIAADGGSAAVAGMKFSEGVLTNSLIAELLAMLSDR